MTSTEVNLNNSVVLADPEDTYICKMLNSLMADTTITDLLLKNNHIGLKGATALAELLECPTSAINEVDVSHNRIGYEAFKILAKAIAANKRLLKFDISYNPIGARNNLNLFELAAEDASLAGMILGGSYIIADLIQDNDTIEILSARGTGISADNAVVITEALAKNTTICALDFKDNNLGNEGALEFARLFKTHTTLTELNLEDNGIDAKHVKILSDAIIKSGSKNILTVNPCIEELAAICKANTEAMLRIAKITFSREANYEDGDTAHMAKWVQAFKSICRNSLAMKNGSIALIPYAPSTTIEVSEEKPLQQPKISASDIRRQMEQRFKQ